MYNTTAAVGYHASSDVHVGTHMAATLRPDVAFRYEFENFFHPYVGELLSRLNRTSLSGMLDPGF